MKADEFRKLVEDTCYEIDGRFNKPKFNELMSQSSAQRIAKAFGFRRRMGRLPKGYFRPDGKALHSAACSRGIEWKRG